jgi:hypothetical protein
MSNLTVVSPLILSVYESNLQGRILDKILYIVGNS